MNDNSRLHDPIRQQSAYNPFAMDNWKKELKSQTNRRWRIEHAQIIDPAEFDYFTEIIQLNEICRENRNTQILIN